MTIARHRSRTHLLYPTAVGTLILVRTAMAARQPTTRGRHIRLTRTAGSAASSRRMVGATTTPTTAAAPVTVTATSRRARTPRADFMARLGFLLLRLATAAALTVDAVVHLHDAFYYDANVGSLITEGELFRTEAIIAIIAALAVLLWARWPAWLLAFLVAAGAFAAVLTFTYIDIGQFAGLPSMYEPTWVPVGKMASAIAEGLGAVLALTGLIWALLRARSARRSRRAQPGR